MTVVLTICLYVLLAAGVLCIARLLRGGSLADQIVALDTLLVISVNGIAVQAIRTGTGVFLDLLVVAALLGFLGTVTVARFIEGRGA